MTISLLIPVYNHAHELVACLRAVKSQILQPDEVIVVDDASTDDPESAIKAAGLRDVVTRWMRSEKNQGAPAARNAAFALSSGDLVMFLDADTILRDDALSLLVRTLERHPEAVFAYSSFYFGGKLFLTRPFSAAALAGENYIHTSSLIRREAVLPFDLSLRKFQDWDLWIRIVKAGGMGVFVPEVLMTIPERKTGMSHWLPEIVHRFPWHWIGWEPAELKRFRDAEAIIFKKHEAWRKEMLAQAKRDAPTLSVFGWIVLGACLAVVSSLAIGGVMNGIFAGLTALAVFVVAWRRPSFALAILACELILGSMGSWLKIGSDAVNDGGVGVRVLWFVAAFAGWFMASKAFSPLKTMRHWSRERWIWPYLVFASVLAMGVVRGLILHQPFLRADANAWGYFSLLVPALILLAHEEKRVQTEVRSSIQSGLVMLVLFSLGLFALFAGILPVPSEWMGALYHWLRMAGLAEITDTGYHASRIFLQSQIMLVPAWLWFLIRSTQDRRPFNWRIWTAWMGIGAALLVSLSRSLWIGLVAASAVVVGLAFALQKEPRSRKDGWRFLGRPLIAGVGALAILALVAAPALPSLFGARFMQNEPAAMSRWSLLPIMQEGIMKHPILGSGFGATLSYHSSDPRVLAKYGGTYTTYAFEWGWLGLWYKIGLVGVVALLALLASMIFRATRLSLEKRLFVISTIVALAVIHLFTPYLDHPLGIGVLIWLEMMLQTKDPHNGRA